MSTWGPILDTQTTKTKAFTMNIAQVAGTYDLFTVSGGSVDILGIDFYTVVAGVGLTSVSLQSNDAVVTTFLSSINGAIANLLIGAQLTRFASTTVLPSTKKAQYTIVGTGSAGSVTAVVRYAPTVNGADIN